MFISSSSYSAHQEKTVLFTVHFPCNFFNEVVYIHWITHCDNDNYSIFNVFALSIVQRQLCILLKIQKAQKAWKVAPPSSSRLFNAFHLSPYTYITCFVWVFCRISDPVVASVHHSHVYSYVQLHLLPGVKCFLSHQVTCVRCCKWPICRALYRWKIFSEKKRKGLYLSDKDTLSGA